MRPQSRGLGRRPVASVAAAAAALLARPSYYSFSGTVYIREEDRAASRSQNVSFVEFLCLFYNE